MTFYDPLKSQFMAAIKAAQNIWPESNEICETVDGGKKTAWK